MSGLARCRWAGGAQWPYPFTAERVVVREWNEGGKADLAWVVARGLLLGALPRHRQIADRLPLSWEERSCSGRRQM